MEKKESELMLEQFVTAQKYLISKKHANIADDLNFPINKLKELFAEEAKAKESNVVLKFIGIAYHGKGVTVKTNDVVELKESDVKYLLKAFPKDWERMVKTSRLNKDGGKQ